MVEEFVLANSIQERADMQRKEMEAIQADIAKGLTDLAEGRVRDFDAIRIIARGRNLLAAR